MQNIETPELTLRWDTQQSHDERLMLQIDEITTRGRIEFEMMDHDNLWGRITLDDGRTVELSIGVNEGKFYFRGEVLGKDEEYG